MEFEFQITDSDGVTYSGTVRNSSYDTDGTGNGFITTSASILYLLGLVGMAIMLANVPQNLIVVGVCALALYLLPVLFVAIGGISFKRLFCGITKYAYLVFNLLVGMWWMIYLFAIVPESILIGISILSFYSVYYFWAILIYNAIKNESSVVAVIPILISIAVSVVLMIIFHQFPFLGMILSTCVTVCGTLSLAVMKLISDVVNEERKAFSALSLIAYILFGIIVAVAGVGLNTKKVEKSYQYALELIASGDYRAARNELLGLLDYKDSLERYEEIKFYDLAVGDKIYHGSCKQNVGFMGKDSDAYLYWTVISVTDGRALFMSDKVLFLTNQTAEIYLNSDEFISEILGEQSAYDTALPITVDGETVRFFTLSQAEVYSVIESNPEVSEFILENGGYSKYASELYADLLDDGANILNGWVLRGRSSNGLIQSLCMSEIIAGTGDMYFGVRPVFTVEIE